MIRGKRPQLFVAIREIDQDDDSDEDGEDGGGDGGGGEVEGKATSTLCGTR